ncbi:MAG: STAS domain-containing protein [Clostridiales bacterium]|jgi:stage II sporulation protein AA (anti-sigma F factor antagonist)|nr:STAS domain-containing protein [Clostridiales bacterium]
MKIISTKREGELKIAFEGELDHHAARSALSRISQLIDIELPRKLVLDLSSLSFMDSSGIAIIVHSYRRMNELEGSLVISNVPGQAYKVLSAAGINRIIQVDKALV